MPSMNRSTCARCIATSPIPSTIRIASSPWWKGSPLTSFSLPTVRSRWSARDRPASPPLSTWRCWATATPGGMLRYALPESRLPKSALDREIELIERMGVEFVCDTVIGRDITLNELDNMYNAVFISIGTWKESWVYLPGTELKGVLPALIFLEAVSKREPAQLGRKVVVIGGGNAAIDSARTALRKGADVTVIYRRERKDMPAIKEETNAAEAEGAKFIFLATPHRIVGDDQSNVKAIEVVK